MSGTSVDVPAVAPRGVEDGVAPHHEPAPARAHTGSASGVSALPVAFGYRYADGSFEVTTSPETAQQWAVELDEMSVFGLYLDHQPAEESEPVRDLIGWASRALVYLEHPDVLAMGFAAHPGIVAAELRDALARVQGGAA